MRIHERLAMLKVDADRLADRHARDASPLQIGDVIVDMVSAMQEVARLAIIGLPAGEAVRAAPAATDYSRMVEHETTVRMGDRSKTTVERHYHRVHDEMHQTLQDALGRGDTVRIEHCPRDQELPRPFDDRRQRVALFDGWDWSARDQFDAGKMGWCLMSNDDGQVMVYATAEGSLEDNDAAEGVRRVASGKPGPVCIATTAEQAELCRRAVMVCDLSERVVIGDRAVKAFHEANARVHAIADQPGRFARDVEAAKVSRDILAPIVDDVV